MKYTKLILDERMIVPEPKIRLEFFLHAIVTGETCELVPKTVDEEYLYAIASGDTSRMGEIYPRTLVEMYYDAILNNSVENLPTPRTRWEEFLRSAITKEPCELEPETSLEIYLSQISSNGGFDYIISTSTNPAYITLPDSINGTAYINEMCGNTVVDENNKAMTSVGENIIIKSKNQEVEEVHYEGFKLTIPNTENHVIHNNSVGLSLEGNSLVNTVGKFVKNAGSPIITDEYIQLSRGTSDAIRSNGIVWKPNTVYTIVYTILETNFTDGNGLTLSSGSNIINTHYIHGTTVGTHKATFITKAESSIITNGLVILISGSQGSDKYIKLKDIYVLEGDWTNKEVPSSRFEGIKSVGQDDKNGHKIKITSRTGNLYNADEHLYKCSMSTDGLLWGFSSVGNRRSIKVPCKPNTTYTLIKTGGDRLVICSHNEDFDGNTQVAMKYCHYNGSNSGHIESYTFTTRSDSKVICAYVSIDKLATNIHLEELLDKKEIQLSEPLRGLPNGIKDKIVKIDNKWYIERNCGQCLVDGTLNWTKSSNYKIGFFKASGLNLNHKIIETNDTNTTGALSDKLGVYWWWTSNDTEDTVPNNIISYSTWNNSNEFRIVKKEITTIEEFNIWIKSNPIQYIYQLATPIYEELSTDPTVSTCTDVTHISNNSIILCNMTLDLLKGVKDIPYKEQIVNYKLPRELRKTPNGVMDKVVYLDETTTPKAPQGAGLYLEENVGEVSDWSDLTTINTNTAGSVANIYILPDYPSDISLTTNGTIQYVNNNVLDVKSANDILDRKMVGISTRRNSNKGLVIGIPAEEKVDYTSKVKKWLIDNNVKVQYPLVTPKYKKMSDLRFVCYEDAIIEIDTGEVSPTRIAVRYPVEKQQLFRIK